MDESCKMSRAAPGATAIGSSVAQFGSAAPRSFALALHIERILGRPRSARSRLELLSNLGCGRD